MSRTVHSLRSTKSGRSIRRPEALDAFSLVELIVVIAIIGVLIGLLIPAVQAARESARRASCSNNLHQLGVALDHHHDQFGAYPVDGERGFGMSVHLLPFLEEKALYERLNPKRVDLPGSDTARAGLDDSVVAVFLCPSSQADGPHTTKGFARSSYLGTSELFAARTSYEFIRDGESNTIAEGETTGDHAWILPGTATGDAPPNDGGDFGSQHAGGAQFVFCDTSVRFIRDDIDPATFQALCTISGGEAVSEF